MKNIILLLTLSLMGISAQAQKYDRKLLNGRWDLYSMSGDGHRICRDSVKENIQSAMKANRASNPTQVISPTDSIAMIAMAKARMADLFQTYMTFDDKGNTKVLLGFEKDENGEMSEETGTYAWTADNKILQTLGKSTPTVFVIVGLTATTLEIRPDEEENTNDMSMSFTRAK